MNETPGGCEIFPVVSRQCSTISSQSDSSSIESKKTAFDLTMVAEQKQNENKDKGVPMEAISKGKVKGSLLWNYFSSGAHWSVLLILFSSVVFVQFLASTTDYFVSIWYYTETVH